MAKRSARFSLQFDMSTGFASRGPLTMMYGGAADQAGRARINAAASAAVRAVRRATISRPSR